MKLKATATIARIINVMMYFDGNISTALYKYIYGVSL